MIHMLKIFFLLAVLVLSALASACGALLEPVRVTGDAPPPIERYEVAVTDGHLEDMTGSVFIDHEPFQAALLQAIQSRDEAKLELLMAENFASGWWRGEMRDLSKADALRELYLEQLGNENHLSAVQRSDFSALMDGTNPLDILPPEVNVVNAIYVTGWGKDGKDEAILFVSRQPDNALRWAGTLVIKGGFSATAADDLQPFVNTRHGYQLYLPSGYDAQRTSPDQVVILAPMGTQGHRERAFITVEPANGRTAERMALELKSELPPQFSDQTPVVTGLDGETAVILERVPSQDMQRVLFVVHEDRLYRFIFVPHDETAGEAYNQMKNLYAVVVNTFKFLAVDGAPPAGSPGGKLVTDLDFFINLLQHALMERDKMALQSMMGETFSLATWGQLREPLSVTPDDAIQQILNNSIADGVQPVLDPDHAVIDRWFSEGLTTDAGEALIPVHVSNWGSQGQDEAVLFIARRADGSLYWQGMITVPGGFEQ